MPRQALGEQEIRVDILETHESGTIANRGYGA
jgi:hypothetical protein